LVRKIVRLRYLCIFVLTGLIGFLLGAQQEKAVPKRQQSAITIHVFKSGLLSGFAHDHIVVAPVSHAAIDPAGLTAEITVVTKEMKVTDPDVSDKDRAEIQSTMLGPKVLDQEKYPEIHFKSSRIEKTGAENYRVAGTLSLHGATKEITFDVTGGPEPGSQASAGVAHDGVGEHFHGATKLKQSDFGIKPISLGGGSVKVKDQLELEFDVYAPTAAAQKNSIGAMK
jgi:polyisoprenoid-binding protein YceI